MKNKNVYILNEYFNREFHSNLILGILSASKGANVYIGTDQDFKFLLKRNLLKSGIFHTKSITHGKEKTEFHNKLKKRGFIITCIDQEGTSVHEIDLDEFYIKARFNPSDLKNIDAFLCWGKYDYDRLIKFFPNQKKKFFLTGSPRKDMWTKRFRSYWESMDNEKSDILIISNFSFYNNYLNLKKILKRKKIEGYYSRSKKLKANEIKYYTYQKSNFYSFIELAKFLALKFPKKKILVRPHPTEKIDIWINKLKKIKNIKISNDTMISKQISQTKYVIQNGSTSALEAYLFDKPVINFEKNNKNFGYGAFTRKFSSNLRKKEEVYKFIKDFNKNKINKKSNQLVNHRIKFIGKKMSSELIVDLWNKLSTKLPHENNYNLKIKTNTIYNDLINLTLKTAILKMRGKYHLYNYIRKKFYKIDFCNIANDIKKLKKILNINDKIKVKQLGKRLIFLSK